MDDVWFVLVNEKGNAYKKTTADYLSIPIDFTIARFRRQLQAEFEQAGDVLKGIHPSQLLVYANKVDLMANKQVDPRSKISDLCLHANDILWIVPNQVGTQEQQVVWWLVEGGVENTLFTKPVCSRVYRIADLNLGYYVQTQDHLEKECLWYENNMLQIHIAFQTEEHALYFQSQFQNEGYIVDSPFHGAMITTNVSQMTCFTKLRRIFSNDSIPIAHDFVSSHSFLAANVLFCSPMDDLYKYQRIEDIRVFGTGVKAHQVLLMSHDTDENNRLALSVEMYTIYNALICPVPGINIQAISCAPFEQVAENRYKVELEISILDQSFDYILHRLKQGSTLTENPLVMKTFIQVKNPKQFCKCLTWKFKQNQLVWQEYFQMVSAVE